MLCSYPYLLQFFYENLAQEKEMRRVKPYVKQ